MRSLTRRSVGAPWSVALGVASNSAPTLAQSARRFQAWCTAPPTGLWMCIEPACRTVHGVRSIRCDECGTGRPALVDGAWTCKACGTGTNPSTVRFCRKCASPFAMPGAWECPCCGEVCPIQKAVGHDGRCSRCNYTVRPQAASSGPSPYTGPVTPLSERTSATTTTATSDSAASSSRVHSDGKPIPPSVATPTATPAAPPAAQKATVQSPPAAAAAPPPPPQNEVIDVQKLGPPGFAWLCREPGCEVINKGDTIECAGCNFPLRPGPWGCSQCGAMNHALRAKCFSCNAAIQPAWMCVACRTRSSVYDFECIKCGEARPHPSTKAGSGAPSSGSGPRFARGGDWLCTTCRKMNHANRPVCYSCETPKPTDAEANGVAGRVTPVGDSNWSCPGCGAHNFRTRTSCWQCSVAVSRGSAAAHSAGDTVMPEINREGFQEPAPKKDGSAAGAGSKVWMASEAQMDDSDWVCAKCMHKNFRQQKDCFRCFTPKMVAPVSRVVVKPKIKSHKI